MKKQNFLFAILLMASLPFFTSCGTNEKAATPPTIMLNAAPGYTGTDITVTVNTKLKVGIIASAASANLSNIKINQTISGVSTTLKDSTFSSQSFNKDFTITAPSAAGSTTLTFIITDTDGESAQASFSITTTVPAINIYTAILLGGQENATLGSFYSSIDNTVLNIATARANSQKADMVYFYGGTLFASIVAVSDNQLQGVPAFTECSTWTTKNATKFKLVSGVDWATITDESGITANAINLVDTHCNNLAVGNIVAFQTATTSSNPGKKGLFKVVEINGTSAADRAIKIEVKIQK